MRGKQAEARHHDFDLVLAGNFRARGEVAETLASHLAILAGCGGPAPGLLWVRDPGLPASATVHGRVAALARRHALAPIEPDADPVRCRLLLLYEPRLLAGPGAALPRIRADVALVVLAQPLLRRGGDAAFDVAAAAGAIAGGLARRQLWCPAGPQIRAQCGGHAAGLPLDPEDLRPCEPLGEWRTARPHRPGGRPVLGRIVRYDDDRLPGSSEKMLQAYPADEDLEVRFLGGEAALGELVKPLPANWRLFAPEAVGTKRFLARLDAYVQHQDEPARPFPRAALQAMAAGRVAVLPPSFRAVLGDGPAYRDAEQVADTVRYLQAEPRFYARYVAEQDAALADRFAPRRFLDRVGEFVRLPKPPRRLHSRGPSGRAEGPRRRTVAFYPTNGVGLGHVTRALAIARRLTPEHEHEPVFFTPCHALALVEHAGFRTEYVPEPLYDETAPAEHARAMAPRLAAALRHYRPAAVVFDGNVPREALLSACAETETPTVWVRRGMWRADPSLARHLALSRFFDAVVEPAEAAGSADAGATSRAADGPLPVPPVMLLERGELLGPAEARRALGLAADRPAALVQLGSGNNNDIERHLDHLTAAARKLDLQLVVAEWLIQHSPVRRRGLRYLSAFPNARYFRAFDFAVSAAGYNSFHELLHHGVPSVFLPNDNQKVDDQRARAAWAESRGAGVCVPRGAETALPGYLAAMLDPSTRRLVSRRARALCPANGAHAAAAAIEAVIERG